MWTGMNSSKANKLYNILWTTLKNKFTVKSPEESCGYCGILSVLSNENESCGIDSGLFKNWFSCEPWRCVLLSSIKKLVDKLNIKTPFANNKPGKKCYYSFFERHKVISQKHTEYVNCARGSVTEKKIKNWLNEVYKLLGEDKNY